MEPKTIVKAVPIPDKKSTDRFGNPTRWILQITEPRELRGLIAFPRGFEVAPGKEYVVEIIRREKNYAVVRPHEHRWVEARRKEDPYIIKIVFGCSCGAWKVEHVNKYRMPLADNWRDRWYIRYALELRRRSEEVRKNAPAPKYYYVAVRNGEEAEKLFAVMRRRALAEVEPIICKSHKVVIYDDEAGKYRVVEAWRGAKDKSWICDQYVPLGYVPVLGYVDEGVLNAYRKAKAEAEELWHVSNDILKQHIDIGRCLPSSNGCRRYVSALSEFL